MVKLSNGITNLRDYKFFAASRRDFEVSFELNEVTTTSLPICHDVKKEAEIGKILLPKQKPETSEEYGAMLLFEKQREDEQNARRLLESGEGGK